MENLNKLISSSRLSHAYILYSSSADALKSAASKFSNMLVCKTNNACGECGPCIRLKTNNYPDIAVVDGFEQTPKKEDVVMIQEKFSESATEGKKIYIIHNIEKLSTIGSNALLKFLEEPPVDTIAILSTLDPNSLLPTIKSRAITINVPELNKELIVDEVVRKGIKRDLATNYVNVMGNANLSQENEELFSHAFELAKNKEFTKFNAEYLKNKEAIVYFLKTLIFNATQSKQQVELAKYLLALEMINRNTNVQLVLETLR